MNLVETLFPTNVSNICFECAFVWLAFVVGSLRFHASFFGALFYLFSSSFHGVWFGDVQGLKHVQLYAVKTGSDGRSMSEIRRKRPHGLHVAIAAQTPDQNFVSTVNTHPLHFEIDQKKEECLASFPKKIPNRPASSR